MGYWVAPARAGGRALAMAALLFGAGPALAGDCGYDYCWGALAIGPDGATGRASSMRTAPWAHDRAADLCGGDCAVEMFYNSCAAIARDRTGAWAFGWDPVRDRAFEKAMAGCEADGGTCRVATWACSL